MRSASDTPTATEIHDRVDAALRRFLDERRAAIGAIDASATLLVDEIRRLVDAGGARLRPAFCYWGFRAAGGADGDPIVRAAAALELLHTFALIHDDLVDGSRERRGVASSSAHLAQAASLPEGGAALALLAGDLATVLADELLLTSGFAAEVLVPALAHYHRMRTEMAAGQMLGLIGEAPVGERAVRRAAALKGGGYTVEGPLVIGAALASTAPDVHTALVRFGAPLGEAFQLRDDLADDDAASEVTPALVDSLVDEAIHALDDAPLDPTAASALRALAASLRPT